MIKRLSTTRDEIQRNFMEISEKTSGNLEENSCCTGIFATMVGSVILILGAVRPDVTAWYLYAYMVYGFFVRTCFGARFDPQAWLIVLVLAPRFKYEI